MLSLSHLRWMKNLSTQNREIQGVLEIKKKEVKFLTSVCAGVNPTVSYN